MESFSEAKSTTSFLEWLSGRSEEDSWIGDFARDSIGLSGFPVWPTSWREVMTFVRAVNPFPHPNVRKIVRSAFLAWRSECLVNPRRRLVFQQGATLGQVDAFIEKNGKHWDVINYGNTLRSVMHGFELKVGPGFSADRLMVVIHYVTQNLRLSNSEVGEFVRILVLLYLAGPEKGYPWVDPRARH